MKEGWEYKKLGDCFISINNGSNIRQVKGAKGIPVTRIETLSNDKFNRERMGYADILDASPYSSYILNDGDILMSHINSMKFLGRAVQYSKKGNETIIHGMNLLRLVPTKDVLSSFLVYQFYTAFFRNQIVSISHQSVNQASFNTTNLKNLKLKVPTISEQQSIVDYLDSAFAKIDAMKANAEKALNEAQALFQASLKEMLEPKEGWEEKVFGDLVVSNIVGLTRGKVEQGYEKKYPYLKMNNISPNNTLCWDDLICVDANEEELEKYCLQEGDFLFNTRNSKEWVGKSTVYRDYDAPVMLYNNNVMRIRFVDTINPVFVAYSFLADYTKDQLEKIKSGTTNVWAIYYRDLSKILLTYPLLSEQQSIVATLDSLKFKVDRLQANYDKISQECDALKQAILRQVFE